jgi:hypothetical protein
MAGHEGEIAGKNGSVRRGGSLEPRMKSVSIVQLLPSTFSYSL